MDVTKGREAILKQRMETGAGNWLVQMLPSLSIAPNK